MQARRSHPAVSSSSSYGLVVHLLLLSTTHRCVAVAFGYRPESVYLERTFTSLTTRAFRRTSPALRVLGSASEMAKPVKRATENKGFGSALVLHSVVRFADLRA